MIQVIGTRGSGKTTKLLNLAQEKGYVIVEPNAKMADYVRHMATEKGLNVKVIGAHELLSYYQCGVKREKYLLDELEIFLDSLGIVGYSNGPMQMTQGDTILMKKGCDYKRCEVPKDCLSCAQSFSADDENGNMILICTKDNGHHVQVEEDGYCEKWKD